MAQPSEHALRAKLPVYVGSFNQPTYLDGMVATLLRNGFSNIIVTDNASTSPKTIELLSRYDGYAEVTVQRLAENIGPNETVRRIMSERSGPFIFTDPDLALQDPLPDDFLVTLFDLSRTYRCRKVGLALAIPDPEEMRDLKFVLPWHGAFTVEEWEKRFWEAPVEPNVYRAAVDTTFFLWNPEVVLDLRRALHELQRRMLAIPVLRKLPRVTFTDLRVAKPGFVARHLPWYIEDGFPEDERAFYKQTTSRASTWLRDDGPEA